MNEKRKFSRLGIQIPVKWKIITEPDEGTPLILDITKDISRGGICFKANVRLAIGSVIMLEIKLPNKKIITSRGKVVWHKQAEKDPGREQKRPDYYIGVEFLDIRNEEKEEIDKFVFEYMIQP